MDQDIQNVENKNPQVFVDSNQNSQDKPGKIKNIFNRKVFGLFIILILTAAVPLIVIVSQKSQDIRQRASTTEEKADCTQEQIQRLRIAIGDPRISQEVNNTSLNIEAEPCIYRADFIVGRSNITIDGKGQAEIRGSEHWIQNDWEQITEGGRTYWKSKKEFNLRNIAKWSRGGYGGSPTICEYRNYSCLWPEQVFKDGLPLKQIDEGSPIGSGEFRVELSEGSKTTWAAPENTQDDPERRRGKVILADDPTGHKIEVTVREEWLTAQNSDNVTIKNFTFKHAGSRQQNGALKLGSNGWTLENSAILYAHGGGIVASGNSHKILNNEIGYNGNEAIVSGGPGIQVIGNRIHHNNFENYLAGWHAGGLKLVAVGKDSNGVAPKVYNNEVYSNNGPGIWCDIGCSDVEISNNNVHDNAWGGIDYEISQNGYIHDNIVWNNGWKTIGVYDPVKGTGAGIMVWNSENTKIENNILAWNNDGITIISTDRTPDPGVNNCGYRSCDRMNQVINNQVLNNKIIVNATSFDYQRYALGWLQNYAGTLYNQGSNKGENNQFWYEKSQKSNFYEGSLFAWNGDISDINVFRNTQGGLGSCYLATSECSATLEQISQTINSKTIAGVRVNIPQQRYLWTKNLSTMNYNLDLGINQKIVQSVITPDQFALTRYCDLNNGLDDIEYCMPWQYRTDLKNLSATWGGDGKGFSALVSYGFEDASKRQNFTQVFVSDDGLKAFIITTGIATDGTFFAIAPLETISNIRETLGNAIEGYGAYSYKTNDGKWKAKHTVILEGGTQFKTCSTEISAPNVNPFEDCTLWSSAQPFSQELPEGRTWKISNYGAYSFIGVNGNWKVVEYYISNEAKTMLKRTCDFDQTTGAIKKDTCSSFSSLSFNQLQLLFRDVDGNPLYNLGTESTLAMPVSFSGYRFLGHENIITHPTTNIVPSPTNTIAPTTAATIPPTPTEIPSPIPTSPVTSIQPSAQSSSRLDTRTFIKIGNSYWESITMNDKYWNFVGNTLKESKTLSSVDRYRDGPCLGQTICKFDTRTYMIIGGEYWESITVNNKYWNYYNGVLKDSGELSKVQRYLDGPCSGQAECKFDTRTFYPTGNTFWESVTVGNKYWNFEGNNLKNTGTLDSVQRYRDGPCSGQTTCQFDTRTFLPELDTQGNIIRWIESITMGKQGWNFYGNNRIYGSPINLQNVDKYTSNGLVLD